MNKLKITHLVMSGGGMQGPVFIGALRYMYLENLHKNITHIAGTSIGSFIGLMVAFKLNIEEMEDVVYKCSQNPNVNHIPKNNYFKLITELGLSSSIHVLEDLKHLLNKKYGKDDFTFQELSKTFGVNMYISTTNINSCENKIFSIEDTPDVSVLKACEASMSIPFIYKPVIIDNKYYYDGGLTNNFPIKIFDHIPKENIIGIILNQKRKNNEIQEKHKISIFTIIKQILNMLNNFRIEIVLLKYINDKDNYLIVENTGLERAINLNINNKGMYFDITLDHINNMIYIGFDEMHKYIKRKEDILEKINRDRLQILNDIQ